MHTTTKKLIVLVIMKSNESNNEMEEGNPKKKAHVDGKEAFTKVLVTIAIRLELIHRRKMAQ